MKWKYCNYCPLDGTCENQYRGHECEMPIKKLLEENTQLHKFLEEFNALDVAKENQQLKELLSKCLDELAEFNNSYYPETQELFSQIVNAIGEK